ncbi:DUF4249 domain-containing protein [Mucilaginibacter lappiensis]|uniref:DUF4249 domain-containing protein n=1 Tax=Mucilaginibacter lappiensis TaxID=354630 RepID=A0A841JJL2_9SPHI|nr:DUF4249 domain-containing protein [Mucilaginibacter lappiensis]MBB6128595.1 hypothetical protein [Mucilaginibacter lappiensis]
MKINKLIYITLLAVIVSCKKPYNPPIVSSDNHYLVVEGVINSGNDSTIINLSRTVKLSENVSTQLVANYTVAVEGEQGNSYALQSEGNGIYDIGPMHLDPSQKYRLHITTPDGKQYASDYEVVKQTPPIDSVGFTPKSNYLQIYANAHDATNNTRYYRWDYSETWRFHAKFQSGFIVDAGAVRLRHANEGIYYCYGNDKSSNIVLGSSEKLSQDVIFQSPITTISSDAEKLELRYSILLKQYALTKAGYQFWENLKKNTEQLGSIFDAQPTQLQGNIHNISDPTEPVIGYISVTNPQSKRIYINKGQLPDNWIEKYPYECGMPDSAFFFHPMTGTNDVLFYIIQGGGIPVTGIFTPLGIAGYTYSSPDCADCTIRGKAQKPSFWIDN